MHTSTWSDSRSIDAGPKGASSTSAKGRRGVEAKVRSWKKEEVDAAERLVTARLVLEVCCDLAEAGVMLR
jgi:hypothetical protein